MCGLVASAVLRGSLERDVFAGQVRTLHHRGPDDSGIWFDTSYRVALGSTRLAIQDTSDAARMPLSNKAGTVRVVFNGEIYGFERLRRLLSAEGYEFTTESDTEVLLAAYIHWGIKCIERFDGMFAFAIYDERNGPEHATLVVARDRSGEKPLFYCQEDNGITFASEVKAILADSRFQRRLDLTGVEAYFSLGYVPRETSILRGIKKLPPASYGTFEFATGRFQISEYWRLPEPDDKPVTEEELLEEFSFELMRSVKDRLVADVPVGVWLSGGLDSSLVVASAAHSASRIKTFTACFPGQPRFDETTFARSVSAHFGTEHYELVIEPTFLEDLPCLAAQFDEPLGDSSLIPTFMLARATRPHVTVALGGDGGDELFGGYLHYTSALRNAALHPYAPGGLWKAIAAIAASLPAGTRGKGRFSGLHPNPVLGSRASRVLFDRADRFRLLSDDYRGATAVKSEASGAEPFADLDEGQIVQRLTRDDFLHYLPDDILVKVDRASMLNSLEVRSPFLSTNLINFAFSKVPSHHKVTAHGRKLLVRRLAKLLLPRDLDLARKQGFSIPLAGATNGQWFPFSEDILSRVTDSIFDRRSIQRLLRRQRQGASLTLHVFALVMFELWRRHYRVALP